MAKQRAFNKCVLSSTVLEKQIKWCGQKTKN